MNDFNFKLLRTLYPHTPVCGRWLFGRFFVVVFYLGIRSLIPAVRAKDRNFRELVDLELRQRSLPVESVLI
jgi:hypothetical protein